MKSRFAVSLVVSALALGCQEPASAPPRTVRLAAPPQFDFTNAPDDLPNVLSYEKGYAVSIRDAETGLIAWAGLPDDPKMLATCNLGGGEVYNPVDFHDVGALQDVIHRLRMGEDVNLHVYQLAGFQGICTSSFIAQGVGRLMTADNDQQALTSGFPGADSWGVHISGVVTLQTGGEALLVAHNRWIIPPDGGPQVLIYRQVDLHAR